MAQGTAAAEDRAPALSELWTDTDLFGQILLSSFRSVSQWAVISGAWRRSTTVTTRAPDITTVMISYVTWPSTCCSMSNTMVCSWFHRNPHSLIVMYFKYGFDVFIHRKINKICSDHFAANGRDNLCGFRWVSCLKLKNLQLKSLLTLLFFQAPQWWWTAGPSPTPIRMVSSGWLRTCLLKMMCFCQFSRILQSELTDIPALLQKKFQ